MSFIHLILDWYNNHKRDLPWRVNRNPYSVWLSEIILQQTRVSQGMSYYHVFIGHYKSVEDLAHASEQEILNLWQGLGYYSRARNLHKTAKIISNEMGGKFPRSYIELKKLPGIGPYTAAAIASICYDERVPAIDGNAYRVYSRVFGLDKDISDSNAHKFFFDFAQELMPPHGAGDFNEAVMELGATVCLPKNPLCHSCPLAQQCIAHQTGTIARYPVKTKKVKVRKRYFHYYFIHDEKNHFIIKRRTAKDVWHNMNDFPMVETQRPAIEEYPFEFTDPIVVADYKHLLTHQHIFIKMYEVVATKAEMEKISTEVNGAIVHAKEIKNIPFPKPIFSFLHERFDEFLSE